MTRRVYLSHSGRSTAVVFDECVEGDLERSVWEASGVPGTQQRLVWRSADRVELMGRLRGGNRGSSAVTVYVHICFGCWCCSKLYCGSPCSGHTYELTIRKVDDVSLIYDLIQEQNPKVTGTATFSCNGQLMDETKKILFYTIKDGDTIEMAFPPNRCCEPAMYKSPPKRAEDQPKGDPGEAPAEAPPQRASIDDEG